jgi:hypothetical protein
VIILALFEKRRSVLTHTIQYRNFPHVREGKSDSYIEAIKSAGANFSMSEKISEKERAQYVKTLDDLCAVLENYSAVLTRNISKMNEHRGRMEKLNKEAYI